MSCCQHQFRPKTCRLMKNIIFMGKEDLSYPIHPISMTAEVIVKIALDFLVSYLIMCCRQLFIFVKSIPLSVLPMEKVVHLCQLEASYEGYLVHLATGKICECKRISISNGYVLTCTMSKVSPFRRRKVY